MLKNFQYLPSETNLWHLLKFTVFHLTNVVYGSSHFFLIKIWRVDIIRCTSLLWWLIVSCSKAQPNVCLAPYPFINILTRQIAYCYATWKVICCTYFTDNIGLTYIKKVNAVNIVQKRATWQITAGSRWANIICI